LQQTLAQLFIVDCDDLDQRREEEILRVDPLLDAKRSATKRAYPA